MIIVAKNIRFFVISENGALKNPNPPNSEVKHSNSATSAPESIVNIGMVFVYLLNHWINELLDFSSYVINIIATIKLNSDDKINIIILNTYIRYRIEKYFNINTYFLSLIIYL